MFGVGIGTFTPWLAAGRGCAEVLVGRNLMSVLPAQFLPVEELRAAQLALYSISVNIVGFCTELPRRDKNVLHFGKLVL